MNAVSPNTERRASEPQPRGGFALHVVPAVLWAAAIFVGGSSGVPQPQVDIGIPFDKVNHVVAFSGLQLLSYRALRYALPAAQRRSLRWLAALAAVLVGVALELYQLGLPDRSAEVADVVADSVGALLGVLVLSLFAKARAGGLAKS